MEILGFSALKIWEDTFVEDRRTAMTAPIFTSIVVNSLFLAFVAAFFDPKCDRLHKALWALAILFWSIGFTLNLLTILRVYGGL